jgi:hypothetical protein
MPSLAAARCFHHPDRPAFAVCVACARPLCQACATPWEGIHYCVSCLAGRRAAARGRGATLRALALGLFGFFLLFAAALLRVWVGALLAEMLS